MNSGTRISKRQVIVFVAAMVLFGQVCFAKYSGGSGTAGTPYKIGSATDLLALRANTTDYDADFVLTADIDLGSSGTFTTAVIAPDTNSSNYSFDGTAFTGIFDGDNHTISNLTINTSGVKTWYLGLFGQISSGGQIKNLGLINVSVTTGDNSYYLGGMVGDSEGGTVNNCYATGTVVGGSDSIYLGVLVGGNFGGTVSNCYATGTAGGEGDSECLGVLVGYNHGGAVTHCYSTGYVRGGGSYSHSIGGLVGESDGGTISNCCSTSDVNGANISSYLGGLTGYSNGTVSNCYSTGDVNSGNSAQYLGGLMGYNAGTLSNCYSTGVVNSGSGSTDIGGLVGYNYDYVSYCYFLNTSGPTDGIGTPLTDAQMKQQTSFTGWDFNNIWTINENVNYPKLAWQSSTAISGVINVTKCTVTAGSKINSDSISFSGTMDANADDFNDANNSFDANFVRVTISSENMDPCVFTFPVNGNTWKKGKFSSTITSKPLKTSFAFDTKKMMFSFSASNVDLTGLSCPIGIEIQVGDWMGTAEVTEATVNGKKPISINLLMGVKNSLRVDKSKFTRNKTSHNITQFTVSGGFSVGNLNDANMADNDFPVWSSQTFTIPAGSFKANKSGNKFTCSNVSITGGVASAAFDFNKCTFTLTLKNTNFAESSGDKYFEIDFASFSGSDEVTLP
jgi:hypothetical protein